MKEIDIQYFLQELRESGLKVPTIRSYLKVLHHYFEIAGNGDVVEKVSKKASLKDPVVPIKILSPEEISTILLVADSLKGWSGAVTKGLIYIAFDTGCRPGEIPHARLEDLDIENHRFFIRTPKGKGRYQDPHPVKLLFPFMDDRLNEFLTARRKYLDRHSVDSPYLFPNIHAPDGTYSDKTRGTYIRNLSEKCGIPFSLRQFRSSVSALIVDQDPDKLKSYMSAQIGHQKAATFELFYWRIKMGAVDSKLDEAGKSVSLPDMHRRAEEITGRRRGRPKKE